MKNVKILTILVLAIVIVSWAEVSEATPLGNAFTYQGHLYDANHVANNTYDFKFRLYNSSATDIQIGSDVNVPDIDVIDGYFTVELDFGSGVFDGNERWLEIGVRPGVQNDPCAYSLLSPRQKVTPTPYALHARSVSAPLLLVAAAPPGTAVLSVGSTGDGVAIGASSIDGDIGLLGKRGSAVVGMSPTGMGVYGSSTSGYAGYFDGKGYFSDNVGIGTSSPTAKLEVVGQVKITDGTQGAGKVLTSDAGGQASWQSPTETDPTVLASVKDGVAWGEVSGIPAGFADGVDDVGAGDNLGNHTATQNLKLNGYWLSSDGDSEGVYVTNTGNVGIGTTVPGYKLHVKEMVDSLGTIYAEQSGGTCASNAAVGYNTSTPGAGCQANGGKFGTRANAAGLKVGVFGYGDGANGTNIGGYFWAQNGGANYAVYAAWGESYFAGNVGIGTTNPAGKLDVNGSIYQRGAILHADYVFEPGYKLESIDEHSEFMWQEKHLPAMPKIQKDENGQEMVEIGARSKGIVEELEKAHIYIEQLNKENKELRAKLTTLDTRLDTIESLVTKLSLKQEGDIK